MTVLKKGTRVAVDDARKGKFLAILDEDFDTEKGGDDFFDLIVDQDEPVMGINYAWERGERIPARRGLTRIWPVSVEPGGPPKGSSPRRESGRTRGKP